MFSYRHAFHAGNHADVLKHLTLVATLRHLMRKDSPLTMIDTHAGAGIYRLDAEAAQTSGEALAGIARLAPPNAGDSAPNSATARSSQAPDAIVSEYDALTDYLALLAGFNRTGASGGPWRVSPGPPLLIYAFMMEPARAAAQDRSLIPILSFR